MKPLHLIGSFLRIVIVGTCALSSARAADAPVASPAKPAGGLPGYEVVRLGQGHNNRLRLAATISGKKGLMILDTGANMTALNASTYGFLQGQNGNLMPKLPKTVVINDQPTPLAVAPNFTVGQTNLGALPVCLMPALYMYDQALVRAEDHDESYDGLLGEEILRHYNAVVDCGHLALYLNTDPSKRAALGAAFIKAGWTRIPMSDAVRDFTVPCSIRGHRFRMVVDTGEPFTSVSRKLVDTVGMAARFIPSLQSGLVGMRAHETALFPVDSMQIGDYASARINMIASDASYAEFAGSHDESKDGTIMGLLGGDVLAANGAIIDIGGKALYLRHGGVPR